ncbi:DNA polymerase III subunit chi [Pollutimonas harenae]|uniref:DNA polymerase III subunit chi n=1 Tax=Pollutimonas harenae TaxID=657015 RepID=A0A853GR48_9BURK|nr:DNA polymerase III subunit chi [Pollutimonas harenae]NYT85548.1 DNA polymerase III subunit chi [Pollutimonas harenae]TEA70633.1 DNA polymerase III subunit chi [Pollutimonas harenae]
MSRVDFAFGAPNRLRTACEVVRKHYSAGRRLVVYTQDRQRLERFDHLLWGFDPTAFVPHVMTDDPLAAQTPVQLTAATPVVAAENSQSVWLINLDLSCPPGYEHFDRILEIVSDHEEDKLAARERWLQYKASGHALHAHKLG